MQLKYVLDISWKDLRQTPLLTKVRNEGFRDAFIVEQELSTSELELMFNLTTR